MAMSKRCIPYTPRSRELKETVFALVTTAGVHLRDQEAFDLDGDNSWRIIPGDVETGQLMVTHEHYDHHDADKDINVVFPIDRLRELAAEGIIAGVSEKHLGFMGYTQQFRDLYERAAPEIARIISRSKADGVILTGGCPLCHRVSAIIQREIEMTGLPTVLITVAPNNPGRQAHHAQLPPTTSKWAIAWAARTRTTSSAKSCWTRSGAGKRAKNPAIPGKSPILSMIAATGSPSTCRKDKTIRACAAPRTSPRYRAYRRYC